MAGDLRSLDTREGRRRNRSRRSLAVFAYGLIRLKRVIRVMRKGNPMETGSNSRAMTPAEAAALGTALALLAACVHPIYSDAQARARQAEARTNLVGAWVAEIALYGETARFGNFKEAGFLIVGGNRYTYRSPAAGGVGPSTGTEGVDLYQSRVPSAILHPENSVIASGGHAGTPANLAEFAVTAVGNIDDDPVLDQWHVNDKKEGLTRADVDDALAGDERAQAIPNDAGSFSLALR